MACCEGGNCGNKQSFGLPDAPPSSVRPTAPKPVVSRYPTPKNVDAQHTVDPREWKHLASNSCRQFDTYGQAKNDDPLPPYTYGGDTLAAVNFPLGGFGTGQINMLGDGTLGGWTIVNQFHNPEHGPLHKMPNNFFAVSATPTGGKQQSFLLATPATYTQHNRDAAADGAEFAVSPSQVKRLQDLPGIQSLTMVGKYPINETSYTIPGLPVTVEQEAMTPLIPNDPDASSIPVATFCFTVTNPSATTVAVKLMHAQQNFVGWDGSTDCTTGKPIPGWGGNVNTPYSDASQGGLMMSSTTVATTDGSFGTLSATGVKDQGTDVSVITSAASETDLFNKFTAGQSVDPSTASPSSPTATGTSTPGAVVHSFSLAPGAKKTVTFVLAWHFPNRMRNATVGGSYDTTLPAKLGNKYATRFTDARAVATFLVANATDLLGTTRTYRDTLYGSTIPYSILDSAAGRVAVMRSPTMWWCENGIVMGNEGNNCCPLNCSHVYGYTMLLERLFPSLGADMHISAFVRNYTNGVTMRYGHSWAIDGALATIIKAYINIRQFDSGNTFLPKIYPNVKDQMNILLKKFDTSGDGVIRCEQQNTYDTAMQGANTFIGSYWVTALRATAEMAKLMGDTDFANAMADRAVLSSRNYERLCWNEKFGYYIADVTLATSTHSYGPGCFVDQVCSAGLSSAAGFGYMFNSQHEHSARLAIKKYNQVTAPPFKDMQGHFFPGDTGITVCTYPNGKLGNGMQYTTLVSAGFTSPVIAGFLLDRDTESAEQMAGFIRNRQSGRYASPWNEPECNLLYSRSMAHWNHFDQACGLVYDATKAYLSYDPRYTPTAFKAFFCAENSWGNFTQQGDAAMKTGSASLSVIRGSLKLATLKLTFNSTGASASVDGKVVSGTNYAKGAIMFSPAIVVAQGSTLTITFTSSHDVFSVTNTNTNTCTPGSGCCPPPAEMRQRKALCEKPSKGCCDSSSSCGEKSKCSEPRAIVAIETTNYYIKFIKMVMLMALIFMVGITVGLYAPQYMDQQQ